MSAKPDNPHNPEAVMAYARATRRVPVDWDPTDEQKPLRIDFAPPDPEWHRCKLQAAGISILIQPPQKT